MCLALELQPLLSQEGKKMRVARISQHENGLFIGEIKDDFNCIESVTTALTPAEVWGWAKNHNCEGLEIE